MRLSRLWSLESFDRCVRPGGLSVCLVQSLERPASRPQRCVSELRPRVHGRHLPRLLPGCAVFRRGTGSGLFIPARSPDGERGGGRRFRPRPFPCCALTESLGPRTGERTAAVIVSGHVVGQRSQGRRRLTQSYAAAQGPVGVWVRAHHSQSGARIAYPSNEGLPGVGQRGHSRGHSGDTCTQLRSAERRAAGGHRRRLPAAQRQ